MLGISRTPLREALHKLEREDWIEKIPAGGLRVAALTYEDIEHTFGIRSVLEAYAARLVAENHKKKDLIRLKDKLSEYKKCLEGDNDVESLERLNSEFHDILYKLSRNPKLIKMINQLCAHVTRYRHILLQQRETAIQSNEDHIKMFEAIQQRDGERVERLVREHIIAGKNITLDQLKRNENYLNSDRNQR
jgi:DNA-binding GntR family transcriptional regulator